MNQDMLKAIAFESAKISVAEEAKMNTETSEVIIAKQFYEKYQNALDTLNNLEIANSNANNLPFDEHPKLNPYQL